MGGGPARAARETPIPVRATRLGLVLEDLPDQRRVEHDPHLIDLGLLFLPPLLLVPPTTILDPLRLV